MSNYIDCQLKVEGTTACLKKLKSSIIVEHDNHYDVVLKNLTSGFNGVINTDNQDNTPVSHLKLVPLKETLDDFEFNFRDCNTFYEWVKYVKYVETTIWVDEEWQKLSLTENKLIVNFTAAWTAPIIEIMLGSKLYPDLKFRLQFSEVSDMTEFFVLEGTNGKFKQIK